MVMYVPGGLIGIFAMHAPIMRMGRMRELAIPYLRVLLPGAVMTAGFVTLIELATHRTIGASQGKKLALAGIPLDSANLMPWIVGLVLAAAGIAWLRAEAPAFRARWNALIEDAKAKGIMA